MPQYSAARLGSKPLLQLPVSHRGSHFLRRQVCGLLLRQMMTTPFLMLMHPPTRSCLRR